MIQAEGRAGSEVICWNEITTGKLYDWKLALLQWGYIQAAHCGMLVG